MRGLLISFGILWFFITLSVESTIIPLHVIFEHRLYLPSVGVFISFSTILYCGFVWIGKRWGVLGDDERVAEERKSDAFVLISSFLLCVLVIILSLSVASYRRNLIW